MKTTLLTAACLSLGLFCGTDASAADSRHLTQTAYQIARQADQLHSVLHTSYASTRYGRQLNQLSLQLVQQASHTVEHVHHGGSLRELQSDAANIDRTYHQIEALLQTSDAQIVPNRGYSNGYRYQGGISTHNYYPAANCHHLQRVAPVMAALQESIHHLQNDLQTIGRAPAPYGNRGYSAPRPRYRNQPAGAYPLQSQPYNRPVLNNYHGVEDHRHDRDRRTTERNVGRAIGTIVSLFRD